MSRFLFITFSGFLLAACGFKPVHAPGGFSKNSLAFEKISVTVVNEEKIGFFLKQALHDRMGEHTNTEYVLSVEPKARRISIGITDDDIASRYDLDMNTKIILTDSKTGKILIEDTVSAVSTFGASRDPYGRTSAQDTATEHISYETADRIIIRLIKYFETRDTA